MRHKLDVGQILGTGKLSINNTVKFFTFLKGERPKLQYFYKFLQATRLPFLFLNGNRFDLTATKRNLLILKV